MMKVCATKKVEVQCLNVATTFIEFAQKYLNLEFTNVTKIIYPQYWLNLNAKHTFPTHLTLLKVDYYFEKFGDENLKVYALLNEEKLEMIITFFKVMWANCKQTFASSFDMQPLDQDVVQFVLKCCATTIIVKAFQVGGD